MRASIKTEGLKRIHLRYGGQRRKFVVTSGPVPEKGDLCTLDGQDWEVTRVEDYGQPAFAFERKTGALRRVFL